MPFRSEAQRRFLWSQHPEIAERWTEKYGSKPKAGKLKAKKKRKKAKAKPKKKD